ncbi:Protein N-acetyltransferase, RimJ/RimL family [Clostridium cavendishii DSM 21758]|uniref:Protein N-acetyltransferase, RimJ/RimL family n=1 Tax=Clostridium cavendishii DSM 21758 TaxID=1121302 RepID=A0A1M6HLX9_9CLOT|nr:GNAT family N-acetyltransferase [Clostridium cavendishii]SHJ23177.1 Protein N-acetyltransferase, RimJ/RimL family [Clostridium cavendishii DSM 21758]
MELSTIKLSQEIYRSDVEQIVDWLSDKEITNNLNEDSNAKDELISVINRVNMPILTHLFNNNCRFFTIKNIYGTIGFLRLVPKNGMVEIVITVGKKELWGKGIGHNAVYEALKKAFFDMRTDEVVAKIKKTNERSRNLFKGIGFEEVKQLESEVEYHITKETFFRKVA